MAAILTITTNPALDVAATTPHVVPTAKLRCTAPEAQAGGGGINVARVAARIGVDSLAVFTAGGAIGSMLCDLMRREPFAIEAVPISGETRQSMTINDGATGEQYRFVFPGPTLVADEEAALLRAIGTPMVSPDIIVLSGSFPGGLGEPFVAAVRREAEELGARLIVDGPPAVLRLCHGAMLIKPNLTELEAYVGKPLSTVPEQVAAARNLIANGVAQNVVVSLGPDGALLITADDATRYSAPSVEPVSAIGAGDSMVGAIVAALCGGASLVDAVADGVAAGAAAILTPGTDLCQPADAVRLRREVEIIALPH